MLLQFVLKTEFYRLEKVKRYLKLIAVILEMAKLLGDSFNLSYNFMALRFISVILHLCYCSEENP